jgi:hypothetical protein
MLLMFLTEPVCPARRARIEMRDVAPDILGWRTEEGGTALIFRLVDGVRGRFRPGGGCWLIGLTGPKRGGVRDGSPVKTAVLMSGQRARSVSPPARQKIYWIQDNLSANWTADIRAFADPNWIKLVATPTYGSYLNQIESHFRPIQELVFNNIDYRRLGRGPPRRRGLRHSSQRRRPRPPCRRPGAQTPSRRVNSLQFKPLGWTH